MKNLICLETKKGSWPLQKGSGFFVRIDYANSIGTSQVTRRSDTSLRSGGIRKFLREFSEFCSRYAVNGYRRNNRDRLWSNNSLYSDPPRSQHRASHKFSHLERVRGGYWGDPRKWLRVWTMSFEKEAHRGQLGSIFWWELSFLFSYSVIISLLFSQ